MLHVLGAKNMTEDTVAHVSIRETGAAYAPVAYVDQMEQAYAAADLMLGRCGAGTVLETAAVGLPAVFVPYPHGNGEQARNARIGGQGRRRAAAVGRRLHRRSGWPARSPPCSHDGERLAGMAEALAGVAQTDAATVLATAGTGGDGLMGLITPIDAADHGGAGAGALHRHRRFGHERHRLGDGWRPGCR